MLQQQPLCHCHHTNTPTTLADACSPAPAAHWPAETVNAHTVLLNAVLCTIACIAAIRWALLAVLPVAVWHVFAVLALSVLVHMPFSLGYHLFLPMDAVTSNLWRRLDICAIFAASALLAYAMSALVLPAGATAALSAAAALVAVAAAWKTWQLQPDQRLADIKTTHALFVGCGCVLYCTPMVVQVRSAAGGWGQGKQRMGCIVQYMHALWGRRTKPCWVVLGGVVQRRAA